MTKTLLLLPEPNLLTYRKPPNQKASLCGSPSILLFPRNIFWRSLMIQSVFLEWIIKSLLRALGVLRGSIISLNRSSFSISWYFLLLPDFSMLRICLAFSYPYEPSPFIVFSTVIFFLTKNFVFCMMRFGTLGFGYLISFNPPSNFSFAVDWGKNSMIETFRLFSTHFTPKVGVHSFIPLGWFSLHGSSSKGGSFFRY